MFFNQKWKIIYRCRKCGFLTKYPNGKEYLAQCKGCGRIYGDSSWHTQYEPLYYKKNKDGTYQLKHIEID